MVFFGVNHAKIWDRDHIMHLSYIVYRRLPALDWFVCCWCHYSYGRKPKAVSNLNFLLFLSCFSWWSSPGRLYEKTTLGMFQWASVIWGGEIIITNITNKHFCFTNLPWPALPPPPPYHHQHKVHCEKVCDNYFPSSLVMSRGERRAWLKDHYWYHCQVGQREATSLKKREIMTLWISLSVALALPTPQLWWRWRKRENLNQENAHGR